MKRSQYSIMLKLQAIGSRIKPTADFNTASQTFLIVSCKSKGIFRKMSFIFICTCALLQGL